MNSKKLSTNVQLINIQAKPCKRIFIRNKIIKSPNTPQNRIEMIMKNKEKVLNN